MSAETIDFEGEGLLDGLQGAAREERLALLRRLAADGMPLSELRRATETGTLMFLPADRAIVGDERYSAAQVAELAGVDDAFLIAARRAMGLPIPDPDDAVYTRAELESVASIHMARAAGIADEDVLELLRVLGRGLAQAAEVVRAVPLKLVLEPGISEVELAERYGRAAGALYPLLNPLVTNLMAIHLRHAAQIEVVNAYERSGGTLPGAREVSVCFADLVGFTRLGEELAPDELGHLAGRLEGLAIEVARPPVRMVKTLGDGAMLACAEPAPLLRAAFELLAAVEAEGEEMPQLRVGAAHGAAVPRAGDWFGRPVNLASRITAIARPGSMLADGVLRGVAGEAAQWSFAGERRIKGVRGAVALYRARPLQQDA